MLRPNAHDVRRRDFLRWLAASPLLASAGGIATLEPLIAQEAPRRIFDDIVQSAEDALDIWDLQRAAEVTVPPAHYGYIMTGVDGEETYANNRSALEQMRLRARRLVDVSNLDTSVNIFGRKWDTPIMIAPCGSQKAFHADGELAVARAAASRQHLQTLSTVSSTAVEEVNDARGEPVWYQLYLSPVGPGSWEGATALMKRSQDAGCPTIVYTVDLQGGSNRVTLERYSREDDRTCTNCHTPGGRAGGPKPMLRGLPRGTPDPGLGRSTTWETIPRLRDATNQKFIIKGIMTAEDAELCLRYGVDGIWVSNHGGRAEGSGQATIDALPEISEAISGRIPIVVDSGFRRGSDIVKGIARGATAVAVGRPYLWGLGAFGQEGVEKALDILTREMEITMRAVGAPSLSDLGPHTIATS
ncbi:MAG TPA: alpha-hydroxy-acid oxidizing enzyme [Gemmatimonadetes bacterium]|nr:alpha-hydroxy-acid oxidizing enzyme [Gemmatimonadota bacterium]